MCKFADGARFKGEWEADAWVQSLADPARTRAKGAGLSRAVAGVPSSFAISVCMPCAPRGPPKQTGSQPPSPATSLGRKFAPALYGLLPRRGRLLDPPCMLCTFFVPGMGHC